MIIIHQQEGLDLFAALRDVLKKNFGTAARPAPAFALPADAFDPLRNQYRAAAIMQSIKTNGKPAIHLCAVSVDIYAPGMNFIFGLANALQKTAIVSTYRLSGANRLERLAKEAVHEVLHLRGLTHCSDDRCVMHFSNTIEDTDRKSVDPCTRCRRQIEAL